MVNTVSNFFISDFFCSERMLKVMKQIGILLLMALVLSPDVMAQAAGGGGGDGGASAAGLCEVAGWIKTILTAAAIIAVLIYVINSFFVKSSVVGDIILYVIIGCAIAASVVYLIGLTGLETSCSF